MKKEVVILVAEDDDGHFTLIKKNLVRSGLRNEILRFADGQETLDFLFPSNGTGSRKPHTPYLMLLDIRMPRVDGVEVLARMKQDAELRKMPVIMLTTTDDPREIERCHRLGCSEYIVKPVEYEHFMDAVLKVGLFLSVVEVPQINALEEPQAIAK
jgi:CheY-like chemotaxis protein